MDTPDVIAAEYLRRNASVDIGNAISRGWQLVMDHMGALIGGSLLAWVVMLALGCVPIVGWILSMVLVGGLYLFFIRRIRGENVEIGDVFSGFSLAFANLALAGLLTWLLTTIGLILCILPGIYLAVGYIFVPALVIDKKLDFWPAMEVSRQVVQKHWWTIFGLAIVLALIVIAGFIACLVGVIIALPVATAALMYAYEDLFGPNVALPAGAPATPGAQP
jgi:uncharacterized membrane protein